MAKFDPTRLIVQLQNTGLAIKDNPTYQLLFQMLKAMAEINAELNDVTSSSSVSPASVTIIQQMLSSLSMEDDRGDEMLSAPSGSLTAGVTIAQVSTRVALGI
jgi:hypothetical protein